MRTTVNIDEQLLAEVKMIAARTHRTIGSVLEDGIRKLMDVETPAPTRPFALPRFNVGNPGPVPGVDLADKEQLAELLGDNEPPRTR